MPPRRRNLRGKLCWDAARSMTDGGGKGGEREGEMTGGGGGCRGFHLVSSPARSMMMIAAAATAAAYPVARGVQVERGEAAADAAGRRDGNATCMYIVRRRREGGRRGSGEYWKCSWRGAATLHLTVHSAWINRDGGGLSRGDTAALGSRLFM